MECDLTSAFPGIEGIHEAEDGYLIGQIQIGGASFHAEFIRVDYYADVQICDGGDVANSKFDDLCLWADDAFETIKLPGFPGEWVLVITPFCV